MRRILLSITLLFTILCAMPAMASRTATIQGTEYTIDTLRCVKIGPATNFVKLKFTSSSKKILGYFITSGMKSNDLVEYRMELGQDSIKNGEKISSCAIRKTNDNEQYFAGVNGDYYLTTGGYDGIPNMACYMNGQIAVNDRDESINYGHFFMDMDKFMWCDFPVQTNSITLPGGTALGLTRINYDIFDNELVLMNDKMGHYTHSDKNVACLPLHLADGETWGINRTCHATVTGALHYGNTHIDDGQAVLAATGTQITAISGLNVGDTVAINLNTRLGDYNISPANLKEACGGDVVILKRGEVITDGNLRFINGIDHTYSRTMLGYNEDRSEMVWSVVEESSNSDGCTYPEGADIMKAMGCYDALNCDGGGSAEMYVRDFGIVNTTTQGVERAVSNGMYAVLKAPADNEVAEIRFVDWAMQFPKYGTYTPKFYGYNKYGLLISTEVKGVKLSCPESLGKIKNDTTFVGDGDGTYALSAKLGTLSASIPVTIVPMTASDVKFRLGQIINDTYREYPVEVEAKVNDEYMEIDPAALSWNSEDPSVVAISAESGILKGIKDGTVKIHGKIGTFTGDLKVIVEKPTARVMAIDPSLDVSTWSVTQVGGNGITATAHDNGMKLTYTGASGRGPYIKLAKSISLWSLPDTLRLRLNPGNAPVKNVVVSTIAGDGNSAVVTTLTPTLTANSEIKIDLPVSKICSDVNDMANYPIKLQYIQLGMNASTSGTSYTIDIPGIEAVYSSVDAAGGISAPEISPNAVLYPNPINQGESAYLHIADKVSAKVEIYNMAGQLLFSSTLSAQNGTMSLPTTDLPRGIYVIRAGSSVNKLIIK
jgi:hypothetical protein